MGDGVLFKALVAVRARAIYKFKEAEFGDEEDEHLREEGVGLVDLAEDAVGDLDEDAFMGRAEDAFGIGTLEAQVEEESEVIVGDEAGIGADGRGGRKDAGLALVGSLTGGLTGRLTGGRLTGGREAWRAGRAWRAWAGRRAGGVGGGQGALGCSRDDSMDLREARLHRTGVGAPGPRGDSAGLT